MSSRGRAGFAWLACCVAANAYAQGVVYVDGAAGDDAWDGRCEVWDGGTCGPKATIQAGIDVAGEGDEVLIADGAYAGAGNKDLDSGGKPITVRSANGDPAACVIDCEYEGRGFYFYSGETAASIVQGLTIRNGTADCGGGVRCDNSSPTLINCTVVANAANEGGGLWCYGGSPTLTDCWITDNMAFGDAGGVSCRGSSPMLTNCVIRNA